MNQRRELLKIYISFLTVSLVVIASAFHFRHRTTSTMAVEPDAIRILAVGDSLTTHGGNRGSYPSKIELHLEALFPQVNFQVLNLGDGALNSARARAELPERLAAYEPHAVLMMIGLLDFEESEATPGTLLYQLQRFAFTVNVFRRITNFIRGLNPEVVNPILAKRYFSRSGSRSSESMDEAIALIKEGRHRKAEQMLLRMIARSPSSTRPYIILGNLYLSQDRLQSAAQILMRGSKAAPNRPIQTRLNSVLERLDDKEALELNLRRKVDSSHVPETRAVAWLALAAFQERQGKLDEALKTAETALAETPLHPPILIYLSELYGLKGESERSAALARQAAEAEGSRHKKFSGNYRGIADLLQRKNVQLFAMQYPLRDVNQLRAILADKAGVRFVENSNLEELVHKDGYEKYFIDRIGGNFGHGTNLGNELIAINAAKEIASWFGARRPASR